MTAESRYELFEQQTAEQYEQIGRFIVEFEKACSWLRIGIILALQNDGLKTQSLARILIDNKYITAMALIDTHDAIMTEIGAREDSIQREVLDQVSKEFRALILERNNVVHGEWFIGYAKADDQDFSKISGVRGNPSKKQGMNFQRLPESAEEISELVDQAKNLKELLTKIHQLLTIQSDGEGLGKFENNLTKVGNTWKSERPEKTEEAADGPED